MGFQKSHWNHPLLNMIVLILMTNYVVESRKISEKHVSVIMSHHGMNHQDNSEMIFFTEKDLKVGNKIPIFFPKRDPSSSPHLLPRDEANSIPFSSKELPKILNFFGFTQDSSQAKAMEQTIGTCEAEPIKGETKFCATSLESMLDFASEEFGPDVQFTVAKTTLSAQSGADFQNYTILEVPREIPAPKMVACHTMPYPYAVYYCHWQEGENKVYEVSLRARDGDGEFVEAVAVCHMDTSHWSPDHASFRVLGIKPGASPVCHFFPADNLVWIPKKTNPKLFF